MSEKSAAHAYIGYMIRSGRLKPAKKRRCVDCNKRAQQYDHHEGYGGKNKTNVQPVCCSCHLKRTYARGEKRTNSAAISGSKHYNWKGGVSRDRIKYQRN